MAVPVKTIRRWSALACALLLVSGVLAACGSGSSDSSTTSSGGSASTPATTASSGGASTTSSSTGGGSALDVSAVESGGDSLGFSSRTLSARAGTVTIRLANGASNQFPHGIAIEGNGVDKDGQVVQPGGDSTVSVKLRPGTYTFYCPVGDHRAEGMRGTLTVQ